MRGFVIKTQAAEDLLRAIEEVSRGGISVSPGITGTVLEAIRSASAAAPGALTGREREVLQLVAEVRSTKQVAAILSISVKTAEFHRMRIMGKLGIHDTAGLVRYAIREGLITP